MDLKELPPHLIALGGSYLGLEFGQMFCRFGCEVSVVEMSDQILPREDPEVSESLLDALETEGMRFHFASKATQVAKVSDGLELAIEKKDGNTETLRGTHLLMSIGQLPNSDDLGLDKAGIATDKNGFIRHNGKLETNVPGIWVLGDVKGGPAFTHVSYDDYLVIFDNLVNGKNRTIDNRMVPYALYRDGRDVIPAMRRFWLRGFVGGALQVLSYGIAIWAMTAAPIAIVATLRETSVLFGAAIAVIVLKEPLRAARIVAACLIVCGLVMIRVQ